MGDVDFEPVSQKAGWFSPVPGGVGPMTIAMSLDNTVESAKRMAGMLEGLGAPALAESAREMEVCPRARADPEWLLDGIPREASEFRRCSAGRGVCAQRKLPSSS